MRHRLLGALAALSLLAAPAGAQPFWVQAKGYANGSNGMSNDLDFLGGTPHGTGRLGQALYDVQANAAVATADCDYIHTVVPQCVPVEQDATADITGSVSPGTVHLTLQGQASISPATIVDIHGPRPALGSGKAIMNTSLGWGDDITFGGLPFGTPIQVTFTLAMSGAMDVIGDTFPAHAQDPNNATFDGFFNTPLGVIFQTGSLRAVNGPLGSGPGFPNGTWTVSGTVLAGRTYGVSGGVDAVAIAAANATSPSVSTDIDAAHTALALITLNTPGATFTSASGATYALPQTTTPEPAPLALLALGTLLLLGVRTRERTA